MVIAARNQLPLLKCAVESVRRQSLDSWQLIVVDDASDDDTWAWLQSLTDPRVQALRLRTHSERCRARNAGLDLARGEYVLFLDQDDALTPWALDRLARAITRNEDAVAVVGGVVVVNARTGHKRRASTRIRTRPRWVWPEVLAWWVPLPGRALMRTHALKALGGWDERYVGGPEDHSLWLRLSHSGKVMSIPAVTLRYSLHDAQWSPADLDQLVRVVRREFAAGLAGSEARIALAVLAAAERVAAGSAAYSRERYLQALLEYASSLRESRVLLSSPLTGPDFARLMARAALATAIGNRGVRIARKAKQVGRRLARKDTRAGTMRPVSDQSGRYLGA